MAESFDPYRKWLGIPPEEQPPNHYRLLGVGLFEADADVIEGAADRQMAHIQRHQLGQFAAISQRLLNELSAAKICLLKSDRKEAYDRALRVQMAAKAEAARPAAPPVAPIATPLRVSPAQRAPVDTVPADVDDLNGTDPRAISELPQERRPVGRRRQTKTATGKAGAKKSGPNLMIYGGSIATGVVVLALVAIVANRDKTPPKVAHSLIDQSGQPPTDTPKPANKKTSDPEPAPPAQPTEVDEPEPVLQPAVVETPVAAPPTADADAGEFASRDVTDLLPLVKTGPKTMIGKWQKTKKGLTLLASNNPFPRILVPYAPPNEYQLEIVVEPQPKAELILGLVTGGNQFTAIVDGWDGETSGLQLIDSQTANENASTHHGQVLKPGKPNRVVVSVRGDRVLLTCDGTKIIDWRGPAERLQLVPTQAVPDKRALFLAGGSSTAVRIRSLRLATLSGKGQELTEPVIAQPDLARVEPEPEMPADVPVATPRSDPSPTATKPTGFELVGHTQPIRGITVHPDSNQVVSASWSMAGDNQPVRIWNLNQRNQGPIIQSGMRPNAVEFSPEGNEVFLPLEVNTVIRQPIPGGPNNLAIFGNGPQYCVSVAAGRDLLAAGGAAGLVVHSQARNTDTFKWSNPSGAPVSAILLTADGDRLWAGCGGRWNGTEANDGNDFKLRLWDGPTRNYVELDGHKGGIWCIAASRDGSRLATASHDRTVRIWDTKTHKSLKTLVGHEGPVYAVAISPDGKHVLSGGADKTVRLWDAKTGRELKRFDGHTDVVRAVALTPNGKYALSGGNDKVLRVWDLGTPTRRPGAVAAKPDLATARRTAVPAKEEVDEATKLVREVFADDFKQAKKPADKIALAEKLLTQSSESQTDTERYALLTEARSLATSGGSPALAIQVINETGNRFDIDTAHEVADLIEQLSKDTLPPAVRKELAETLLPIADEAVARSDYDTARRLLAAASQSARKTNDNALVKQIATRVQEIGDAKKSFDAYRKALDKLEESADDPAANLAAGKYLCFVKQDWDKGLAHLAKGSDDSLRQIAELEIAAPANPEEQVKLGDLWWALFEQAKGHEKTEYADRCDKWYGTALPGLKGLTQTKVAKRIEELAAAGKPAAGGTGPTTTAAANERPAAGESGGTAAIAKMIAKIKLAIRKELLVRTGALAGREGTPFAEIPPAGGILAGFNYTIVPGVGNGEVSSLQAIYWTTKGTVNGQRWGVEAGPVSTIMAKKGYAVAGLNAGGSYYDVGWFEVVFAKLGATGLDMADKYTSPPSGTKAWSPRTLGDNGQLVVGFFGTVNNSQLAGLGLVQMPEK